MTRVLGFDLATRSGWAVVESGPKVVSCDIIDVSDYPPMHRLVGLKCELKRVIRDSDYPDLIIWEEVSIVHGRNAKTLSLQNRQYGAMEIALGELDWTGPIKTVTPREWQSAMLGIVANRKSCPKLLKQRAMLQLKLRTGYETNDSDIGDAAMIACYGLGLMQMGMIGPQRRVAGESCTPG